MAPEAEKRIVIRPNASLSPYGALAFLAWMCALSFTIAGSFAWLGYWMVFPFSGLEMVALALALYVSLRANSYREVVSLDGEELIIESGSRQPQAHWRFQRAWARVRLERGPYRNSPSRLLVSSHGRDCELGCCLTDEERVQVARRLRSWLASSRVPEDAN